MQTRLQILCDAGLINQDIYLGMLRTIDKLENKWQLTLHNSQGEMAITHMANALMRCLQNKPVTAMDPELFSEIAKNELFPQIEIIHHDLLNEFSIEVPESEQSYLLANLFALYMAQQD